MFGTWLKKLFSSSISIFRSWFMNLIIYSNSLRSLPLRITLIFFFFFNNSGIQAATFPIIPTSGVQRPNGRDVKSVMTGTRTQVTAISAEDLLPLDHKHRLNYFNFWQYIYFIHITLLSRKNKLIVNNINTHMRSV